jgi:hypothetical protein
LYHSTSIAIIIPIIITVDALYTDVFTIVALYIVIFSFTATINITIASIDALYNALLYRSTAVVIIIII